MVLAIALIDANNGNKVIGFQLTSFDKKNAVNVLADSISEVIKSLKREAIIN